MDVVITYVDGNDPCWKVDYEKFTEVPVMAKRFRDWGTLRYLLRGIEKFMPFVGRVHLVVSHKTQVPVWSDTDQLNIVLHEQIIPKEFLPTFNSTAIEMFLHRIPGLDEQYLYFNDDMFPVCPCKETDFFLDGKAYMGMATNLFATGLYKQQCRNADRLARTISGKSISRRFVRPQHICSPMIKSACEEGYAKAEQQILHSISRLREPYNLNQYFFLDFMYHTERLISRKISNKHFSTAIYSAERISSFIKNPDRKFCCINDVRMSEDKFSYYRDVIIEAFEYRLPDKSRFEK